MNSQPTEDSLLALYRDMSHDEQERAKALVRHTAQQLGFTDAEIANVLRIFENAPQENIKHAKEY